MSTQSECEMISLSCCCTAGSVTMPFSTIHISVLGTYLFARQKWWREFFSRAPLKFMINILNLKVITGMAYILKKLKITKKKRSLQVLAGILGLWFKCSYPNCFPFYHLAGYITFLVIQRWQKQVQFFSTKIVLVHVWTKKDISDKNKYKTKVKPHRPMLKRSSGASLFS